jgi:hypothetical protein
MRQMHESRDEIRRLAAGMTDTDLDRPAWHQVLRWRGFRTVGLSLDFCIRHTWGHVEEARIWLGYGPAEIAPAARHKAFLWRIGLVHGMVLDPLRLRGPRFTLLTEVTGPGGGCWTTTVSVDGVTVTAGVTAEPDLTLTMGVDASVKWLLFMASPEQLMADGEVQVSDFRALWRFSELLRRPDTSLEVPVAEWP